LGVSSEARTDPVLGRLVILESIQALSGKGTRMYQYWLGWQGMGFIKLCKREKIDSLFKPISESSCFGVKTFSVRGAVCPCPSLSLLTPSCYFQIIWLRYACESHAMP
jgi:hypothetical protein